MFSLFLSFSVIADHDGVKIIIYIIILEIFSLRTLVIFERFNIVVFKRINSKKNFCGYESGDIYETFEFIFILIYIFYINILTRDINKR